jgi:hypothetical protein
MKIVKIVTLSIAALLAVGSIAAYRGQMRMGAAATHRKAGAVVDVNGNLRVPSHYRTSYQFLGTWAIAADKGPGSKALHVVYASPGAIAAYRRTGRFPDGAVLVKEVYQTATKPMATGTVSHAKKLQGWFVMVKESKDIHPNNKLWGDGWAWSWFDAGNPLKTTSTNFKTDCLPCHTPARPTDLVYVEGYPPLHGAK